MPSVQALIFDFGNVLCRWTPPKSSSIDPTKLKQIMTSDIWYDYERGRYASEDECYKVLEERFAIQSEDLSATMAEARQSLRLETATLEFLTALREQHSSLKLYGLSNTPHPEEDAVQSIGRQWPIFDHIYISGSLGMRKPDICCYEHVLKEIGLSAEEVLFVDDSAENVLAAQSIGINSILFQNHEQISSQIKDALNN
ncbi:hypothetical protein N7509_000268 [Penicillium cosmopolitanum]|uniref:Uncharacterized protein n=1 Tax=Penicillium cosmopolitanum TaxID=1131564 RepID=A0A9X0BDW9_9EURO|nr:uncharacterized protein N7509_000268 [Penicillium cosmopolitanum]KAJ5413641.1 hypothetical protein N7509_000268 [Penicillium cosmopolitanum]